MITIGLSTREKNKNTENLIKNIKETSGIKNPEIIIIENNNKYSLTEAYNLIIQKSNNNIVILIHDDIIFEKNTNFGKKIINYFNNSDYGILGVVGSTIMPESGVYWEFINQTMVGQIKHIHNNKTYESNYSGKFINKIIDVQTIDGVFIALNKKRVKTFFNEEFKGFHFYDHSFCIENKQLDVKIGVVFGINLKHKSIGVVNDEWEKNRLQFINKYKLNITSNGEVNLLLPAKVKVQPIYEEFNIKIKNEPKLAIIIPTKNNFDLLNNCINSLIKTKYNNYKIYIADTGSNQEELDKINLLKNQKIKIINYDFYNFSKINNDVVKNHIENDTELLLFCNNDILMLNDAISRMVEVYLKNKKEVGTIGARLHFEDGSLQHNGMIAVYFEKHNSLQFGHDNFKSHYKYDLTIKPDVIGNTAAFMMVSKNNFLKVNGFNEEYIECFEDVEFNAKMIENNLRNIFCGDCCLYHFESKTRSNSQEKQIRESEDLNKRLLPFISNLKKYNKYIKIIKNN